MIKKAGRPRAYQLAMPFTRSQTVVCPSCGANVHPPCHACAVTQRLAARRGAGLEAPLANSAGPPRRADDPAPDAIADACRRIQAGWSAAERASRRVLVGAVPWTAPAASIVAERELPV